MCCGTRSATPVRCVARTSRFSGLAGQRRPRRPPRGLARFLAGRRAAFFVDFFAVFFLADFFAGRRADFFAPFFALFFALFFAAFLALFFTLFLAAFRAAFFGAFFFRGAAVLLARAGWAGVGRRAGAGSGVLEGIVKLGAGGGNGSLMGVSSIHPPLVQPVSISSSPDIGAPCSQRGATRRRYRPRGPVNVLNGYNLHIRDGCARFFPGSPLSRKATMPIRPPKAARSTTRAGATLALLLASPALLGAQVVEIQVTPDQFTLEAGKQRALYAAAYDRQGNLVNSAVFAFTTSDSTVATVSPQGTVMAVASGVARIQASAGGRSAAATVTVTGGTPPVLAASLRVEPRMVSLLPLEPVRLVPRALRDDGTQVAAPRISWKSLDSRTAAVDRDGLVVGVAPGQTIIEAAMAGGLRDTVLVTVDTAVFTTLEHKSLAPGGMDTLSASVPAQGGRRLSAGLTWRSSDTTIVRVGSSGEVVGVAPGQAEVAVSGYGMTGRVRISVHPPVHAFTIIPRASAGPVRVPVGGARRFQARAEAADSTPIEGAVVRWALADSGIASFVPETGMLTGRRPGATTLSAHLDGFQPVTWQIEVVPAGVVLERRRLALAPGERARIGAELVDEAGAAIPAAGQLTWSVSGPAVTVAADGTIEARRVGRATITAATPWGTRDSAAVFVVGDLLLSSNRGGANPQAFGIHQLRFGSDSLHPVLADGATNLHAAFSPDRTRIAFSSSRAGRFDLYLMNADGTGIERVTTDSAGGGEPAWTPDGRRIVYSRSRGGTTEIASVGLDGSDLRTLAASPGGNQSPSVSPDGRTIAFASARDGNFEIYRMGIDGGNAERLTTSPAREQSPRFLPSGDLLYVTDRPRGGSAVMRLGASGAVPIVESPDPIVSLAVARDGSRIAFVTGRMLDRTGSRIEYRLVIHGLGAEVAPVAVRLLPDERIATPSF